MPCPKSFPVRGESNVFGGREILFRKDSLPPADKYFMLRLEEISAFDYLKGMQAPTSFLLVVKTGHAQAKALAATIQTWLQEHGAEAAIIPAGTEPEALCSAALGRHAVLILGGDGTVVGVCRKLAVLEHAAPPYIAINFGRVGFLAEVPPTQWQEYCRRLLAGELQRHPRLALAWEAQGQNEAGGFAINDVVVGRGAVARVLGVRIVVEYAGERHDLGWVRSDGILLSTPQGTSAYTLAAHGPLLHPDVQGLALTPISPFFKTFPAMVLPADRLIRLEIAKPSPSTLSAHRACCSPADIRRHFACPDAVLTVDGQESFALSPGDIITVQSVDTGLSQLVPEQDSYFTRLRERGFIATSDI